MPEAEAAPRRRFGPGSAGRRIGFVLAGIVASVVIAFGGLLWRLNHAPVPAGPLGSWALGAIEQKLGGRKVNVEASLIEREASGEAVLRFDGVSLRGETGAVLVRVPRVAVRLTDGGPYASLWRPRQISVIGASLVLRPDADGRLTIRSGSDGETVLGDTAVTAGDGPARALVAVVGWLATLHRNGFDGGVLGGVSISDSTITLETREGRQAARFEHLNISLTRPREGGLALTAGSNGQAGPWTATVTASAGEGGLHTIEAAIRDIAPEDLIAAFGASGSTLLWDTPLSAVGRFDVGSDGDIRAGRASLLIGPGRFGSRAAASAGLTLAEGRIDTVWNPADRSFVIPRATLAGPAGAGVVAGRILPPAEVGGPWQVLIDTGQVRLAGDEKRRDPPVTIDRLSAAIAVEPVMRRLSLTRAEAGIGPTGVAMSGALDFSTDDPVIDFGLAANRVNWPTFRTVWPAPVLPTIRAWFLDHVLGGQVERTLITLNAPVSRLRSVELPLEDRHLRIEIDAQGASVRPVPALPALQGGDVTLRVIGKTVRVRSARAQAETASGRKITLTDLSFDIADTSKHPPMGRARARAEGPADAAAEILAIDAMAGATGLTVDPSTVRGQVSAQIAVALPMMPDPPRDRVDVSVDGETTGLVVERLVRGARLEAGNLKFESRNKGIVLAGPARLAGAAVTVDYRRERGDRDAEVRLQGTLDEAARGRLGLDLSSFLTGPVALKLAGKLADGDREARVSVEADLAAARINDPLFGWVKAPGRQARATFTLVQRGGTARIDDFAFDGPGAQARGTFEFDAEMSLVEASLPQLGFSEGDRLSLRLERTASDGLKIAVRGEVFDARAMLRSSLTPAAGETRRPRRDRDLDIEARIATVIGHNGEAIRGLEARGIRRANQWRTLSLSARGPRDAAITGDLRQRPGDTAVVYLEMADAGAFFRFADLYSRMVGGRGWVAVDPPGSEATGQDGQIGISDFSIRGENALEQVATRQGGEAAVAPGGPIRFTRFRADFTRSPGRLTIKDGVVLGPVVGATMEGEVNGRANEVRIRGTLIPAYELNNLFARLPILGPILGGSANEGLVGVTYEVAGPVASPSLRVSPMSVVAPGFLRRLFDFRGAEPTPPAFADPNRQ